MTSKTLPQPTFQQQGQQVGPQINVAGNQYFIHPASLTPISATAPAPARHFVGRRTAIDQLTSTLLAGHSTVITALQGMGGIGKTALARQLAVEMQFHFTGGVFWGSLVDHIGAVQPILRTWGRTCAQDFGEEQNAAVLAENVRGLLTGRFQQAGPLLVIIDDVRPPWQETARLLLRAVPAGVPCLFTTRDEWVAAALGARIYHLDTLEPDAARQLLNVLAGTTAITDIPLVDRLLATVGYLPLAIELAGALLQVIAREPGFVLGDIVDQVVTSSDTALTLPGHPGLAATFAITYDALDANEQRLFRWLGIFAPGPLILEHVAGVLELTPAQTKVLLRRLVTAAYLDYGATPGLYTMHPLVRDYAVYCLDKAGEREPARQRHLAYYLDFAKANQTQDPVVWDRLEAALPDLEYAIDTAIALNNHNIVRTFGYALCINSEFLFTRGYQETATALLHQMLHACQALKDDNGEADALCNLGLAAREQGDYAVTKKYLERALQLQIHLNNTRGQATALRYLGLVARDQGEFAAAKEYHEQALDIDVQLNNLPGQAASLGNLGVIARFLGNYAAAKEYHEQALQLHIRLNNSLGQAIQLGNLGVVARHLGDYTVAKNYHEQALLINLQLNNPRGQAITLGNLGVVARDLGDYAAAKNYHEQALQINTRLNTPLGQAIQLSSLGIVARGLGDYAAAKNYHQQALKLNLQLENLFGQAIQLSSLGVLARDLGDYAAAKSYHEHALKLDIQLNNPHGQAIQLDNLGIVAREQGEYAVAKAYHERALQINTRLNNPRNKAASLDNLGVIARLMGNYVVAKEYHEQALAISTRLNNPLGQAQNLGNLGLLAEDSGDDTVAQQHLTHSASLYRRIGLAVPSDVLVALKTIEAHLHS